MRNPFCRAETDPNITLYRWVARWMAPASKPNTHRPTVVVLLKNTQFCVGLGISSEYHYLRSMFGWEPLPVFDDIYPAGEEGRSQVSGKEIENVDDHTTQEGAVEHPERHQWMFGPLHLVKNEEEKQDTTNDEHGDNRIWGRIASSHERGKR